MKVRYKTLSAGPDGVVRVGDVRDVDDRTGTALISGGYAEAVGVKSAAVALAAGVKKALKPSAPDKSEPKAEEEPQAHAKPPRKTTKKQGAE